jgi:DNA modification methylase
MPELIWDGKYDQDGKRAAPVRVALPFQTVETVNESVQERQRSLDLFSTGRDPTWRNRLIWGDKKYVLPALLDEFAGKVDLIYVDPPFATGANFSYTARVPDDPATPGDNSRDFIKQPSMLEQKAYRDTWGTGLDGYLRWFYETALFLSELLSTTGSLYVHLDWHIGHYAKAILDEVMGQDVFRNEIVWKRSSIATNVDKQWRNSHDVLLYYSKSATSTFHAQFGEYSESSKKHFSGADERGAFQPVPLLGSGRRAGETGQTWRGIDPNRVGKNGMHWLKKPTALDELDADGKIYWPSAGGLPRLKYYVDEAKGPYVSDVWDDIFVINSMARESVGYDTQKPEALLERILLASSNEDDLILDCVCGSGTTAVVADRLGRRWIAADLGRFSIHTTRKRLLSFPGLKPFVVQNLGKYERQLWQTAEFGESAGARTAAYRRFILDLYHGEPINGYVWLHGLKNGRIIHVGTVDAPVTVGDIRQIATEFRKALGSGDDSPSTKSVDVLGWDFAFELNEVARQEASKAGIEMRFVRIPREVLERKAVEQGDISFYELAALSVDLTSSGKRANVYLTDFVIPLDDVPNEIQSSITSWTQWIDYWAIDWNNKDDTFHNQWQSYRTRENSEIELSASYDYEEAGSYTVVVKVIDILGNDTTKTLTLDIPASAS